MPPLTPAVVHVLLSLAQGERHGYAILKDVQRQANSGFTLGPGTIYGTLQRLMDSGWVAEIPAPSSAADERRRYYRLTRGGREALKTEMARLTELLEIARERRITPRGSQG